MAKLDLSVAIGDYDRTRPLFDGPVQIDGVDPVYMTLTRRRCSSARSAPRIRHLRMSLSSYTVKTAAGDCPYVGVPAFVSRMFRHTSIYVRTDRIKQPEDLKGKQGRPAGVPAHRQRLGARDPGRRVRRQADRHHWIRGGIEHAGRPEKITIKLPAGGAARQTRRRARRFPNCWPGRDRRLHGAASAGDRAAANRTSAGCSATRSRRPRTITSAPAFSRSCI